MDAFFQILAEKIITVLEGFFQASQSRSSRTSTREAASGAHLLARLTHRLSAG